MKDKCERTSNGHGVQEEIPWAEGERWAGLSELKQFSTAEKQALRAQPGTVGLFSGNVWEQ